MMKKHTPATKWILPPILKLEFDRFVALYDIVFKNPGKRRHLLIHGAPGVGKSMFTHAFETLYRKDYHGKLTDNDVKRLNVSALAENLFESEIFGHVKGAFTGAIRDKTGFLENTKLLILEEIGELSKPIQAKLLTFMEDGIYYRVGENTPGKSADDIQIIATTNAPLDAGHFRQDFLDRCYIFHVPALHERRGDILYILADQYPDCFRTLSNWQLFRILCYNWPGNMREIEKFGTIRQPCFCQKNFFLWDRIEKPFKLLTAMNIYYTDDDIQAVDNFFDRGHLSITPARENPIEELRSGLIAKTIAFKNIEIATRTLKDFENISILKDNVDLSKAGSFFSFFPLIFHVKPIANVDLYDVDEIFKNTDFYYDVSEDMIDDIFSLLSSSEKKYAKTVKQWVKKAEEYGIKRHFDLPEEDSLPAKYSFKQRVTDLFDMTETDLLISYYRELLSRTGDNIAKTARLADVNRKTLDSELIKLGIHPTRK